MQRLDTYQHNTVARPLPPLAVYFVPQTYRQTYQQIVLSNRQPCAHSRPSQCRSNQDILSSIPPPPTAVYNRLHWFQSYTVDGAIKEVVIEDRTDILRTYTTSRNTVSLWHRETGQWLIEHTCQTRSLCYHPPNNDQAVSRSPWHH
jgi:hypothetical protein